MKQFYLLSHPEAIHHIQRLRGGWTDFELTDKGRADAERCAQSLFAKELKGVPIISSDLQRAAQAGQIIAKHLHSKIKFDSRLREIAFGEAEGKPNDWLENKIALPNNVNPLDYSPVNGHETKRIFATRIYNAMEELYLSYDKLIIITHGYACTLLITCWVMMPIESTGYVQFHITPGSISHLRTDEHNNRQVVYLNSTKHL